MKISIIGLGLIGGSMAIDLKKRGFATKIIGVDNNSQNAQRALDLGIADEIMDMDKAVENTDIVVLATPLKAALKILPHLLDISTNQVITDVCSTKKSLCETVKNHPNRKNYIAAHPMAGTENSGPDAAQENLFDNRVVIFCDTEKSDNHKFALAEKMYNVLRMKSIYMNSQNHDEHVAYVSHISHISSFALAITVLQKEKNEKNILALASGGFESTVRLAKSSSSMWTPIFCDNQSNLLEVIDTYMNVLSNFKAAIVAKEEMKIDDMIIQANKIRKILN